MKIIQKITKFAAVFGVVVALLLGGFITSGTSATLAANSNATEILIGFESEPNPATFALIKTQGWEVTGELPRINVLVVTVPDLPELPNLPEAAPTDPLERAREALEAPGITEVSFVEENGLMYAHGQITPWGVERIGAVEAHNTSTGVGVGVAILDTGIDVRHEDLTVAGGYAVVNCHPGPQCATTWDDDHGHGTHVAGTVSALDNNLGVLGTAPNIELFAVKVLDRRGSGTFAGVAEGIIWAADQGIEVLNMSLGGGHSDAVQSAVIYAYNEGSLIVASAGNSGPGENTVRYPAAYAEVIAVSATDQNDNIASWSSRGEEVEFAAPGVSILSTVPGNKYEEKSGTSMSAPHVAGTAALVWATNLELTNVEVRGVLRDTAEDIGLASTEQGYGLINAATAVGIEPPEPDPHAVEITPGTQEGSGAPGEMVEYVYTVSNTGTEDDSYNLGITNANWETSISSSSVSLVAGESVEVTVSHTIPEVAEDGDFDAGTLTAVSQTDSTVSDSVTFTTTAKVAVEGGTVSVVSIDYTTRGGRNNDRHLDITLTLKDDLGNPVADASVSATLSRDNGSSWNFGGTTNSDGTVTFSLMNHGSGCYDTEVAAVDAEGLDWDGITPNNSYCK